MWTPLQQSIAQFGRNSWANSISYPSGGGGGGRGTVEGGLLGLTFAGFVPLASQSARVHRRDG